MIEQLLRDSRIAMIYEGTNGIQALDLVGRKLPKNQGQAMMSLISDIRKDIKGHDHYSAVMTEKALKELESCNVWLLMNGMKDPEEAAAVATPYLHVFSLTLLSWMWFKLVRSDNLVYNKLCQFFFEYQLPELDLHVKRLKKGKGMYFCIDDNLL